MISVLQKPFNVIASSYNDSSLFINTIFEGFTVKIRISALTALIISSPVHIFNILRFVFPGLLPRERKVVLITLICSFVFVLSSFFYSYYSILPVSIEFLTSSGFIPQNTGILLNFSGNISYVLQFILVALVIFQIPLILEILMILNILSRKSLVKYGRYVIILFFIISALLTPPDFVTQIGIALPLTFLYFITLIIAKIFKFGE